MWGTIQAASAPKPSLRVSLQAKADAQFALVSSGSIREVSANGQNVTLSNDPMAITPQSVLDAWTYLVDTFDRAYAALGGTPTDDLVEAKMETYLRPVTGYTNNFMYLSK